MKTRLDESTKKIGKCIVGKKLKEVNALVYFLNEEDTYHPQELQFVFFAKNLTIKFSTDSDGSSLILSNGGLLERDFGENGKEIVKNFSSDFRFEKIINKEILNFNPIYSKKEKSIIGFYFLFEKESKIYILNLGDDIFIFDNTPDFLLKEEAILLSCND